MQSKTAISARRACRLMGLARSVLEYAPRPVLANERLQERIIELAAERRRFGYRRIHVLLRREGRLANVKRVHRLYRAARLQVQRRKRARRAAVERTPLLLPCAPNQVWSMDFVMDALHNGRRLKCLTIVDDFTKEAIDIAVDHGVCGLAVTRALDRAALLRGLPKAIRTDQGPEFTSKALDQWSYQHGVQLKLIEPGKPTQNAFIESFNGRFRDECLNDHLLRIARPSADRHRCVAPGLQRAAPAQRACISNTVRVCSALSGDQARQRKQRGTAVTSLPRTQLNNRWPEYRGQVRVCRGLVRGTNLSAPLCS